MNWITDYAPAIGVFGASLVVLMILSRLIHRTAEGVPNRRARNQAIMLVLSAGSLLLVILTLPISDSLRGNILSFIAILLSATIALSSTTFLGNALAGVMLRVVRNFRMGDFVRVGEYFGRVSDRGIFHTEIQTEDRDLTTLPNLYLVTHPLTTVRSSGTIISATVSLGYEVPRARIQSLLLEAARRAELTDPFVQILDLGDFSVTHRIAGLLPEVKQLVSARSHLRGHVLDALHEAGVEIVSPNFMNTRAIGPDASFIPKPSKRSAAESTRPEDILFDKADEAESLEKVREEFAANVERSREIAKLLEGGDAEVDRVAMQKELETLELRQKHLEKALADSDTKS